MSHRNGGLALSGRFREVDNLYKKSLTERYGARLVGTFWSMALGGGLVGASVLSGHLRTPGDLLSFRAFPPERASPGGRRVFVPTRGNRMANKTLKLGDILGGEKSDDANGVKRMQEVVLEESGHVERVSVDVSVDELNALRSISSKIRKCIFTDKVTKAVSECVMGCVGEYEELMMRMIAKNERLSGRIDECEKMFAQKEMMSASASYASVAGKSVVCVSGSSRDERVSAAASVKEKTYAVVVKAKDESVKMSSDEVKERVMKNVAGSLNVRVKAVRKTRSGGLAIEAASECDIKTLRECKMFGDLGLKVEAPKKIGPKVIVFDIENEMTNDDVMKELYVKNLKSAGISEEEFQLRARIVNRTSKKGMNVGNTVIELSKGMRDVLLREGRVYVRWRACKVREFVNVMRCHMCLAFGHMMRECTMKERLCENCGESGHLKDKCKSVSVCRNCKLRGKKCDHSVLSAECPEYVRMLVRERARISDD